jgi:hypothetical protein
MNKFLSGAGAAIAVKVVTGFAVVALAAVAAGAATEAAITGSANPSNWGQQVKHTVATCKATLRASGTRGIGPCVSAFAKQHGKTENPGNGDAKDKAKKAKGDNNGNGKGHGQGNGQSGNKDDSTAEIESGG